MYFYNKNPTKVYKKIVYEIYVYFIKIKLEGISMRKVLEEICEHEIYITRRKINRRDFVISLISISGSILFIISLIFFFLFLPDHWITSLFMGLSVFVVLFFLISILGLKEVIEENEVLGILKDYEISFKVIEKKELIEYIAPFHLK